VVAEVRALTSKHTPPLSLVCNRPIHHDGGGSAAAVLVQPGVAWQIAEEGSAGRVGGATLRSNDGST